MVFDRMRPEIQESMRGLSTSSWERIKRLLYNKQPAAIRKRGGGKHVIGERGELRAVSQAIAEFGRRVVEAAGAFVRRHVSTPISAKVLTGGGTMISPLREALIREMKREVGGQLYDLLDENEPRKALRLRGGLSKQYSEERWIEQRLGENQELVRGGSAIGACSVYFG
jgi:hypothetical protein